MYNHASSQREISELQKDLVLFSISIIKHSLNLLRSRETRMDITYKT